jgi:hypothetical protein
MFKRLFISFVLLLSITSTVFAVDIKLDWNNTTGAVGYYISMSTDNGVTWLTPIDVKLVKPYTYLNVPEDKFCIFKIGSYKNATTPIVVWNNFSGVWYDYRLRDIITTGLGIQ